jgi:molybdopterin synthase catalytic subunit
MTIRLFPHAFDPWAILQARERDLPLHAAGASSVFIGRMRDSNEGEGVVELFLEHYPGMTERELERIVADAQDQWPLIACEVVHRVGTVQPGEVLVLVAVWSAHRRAARAACVEILERLKHEATFWKQETLRDGRKRWVERNTPG